MQWALLKNRLLLLLLFLVAMFITGLYLMWMLLSELGLHIAFESPRSIQLRDRQALQVQSGLQSQFQLAATRQPGNWNASRIPLIFHQIYKDTSLPAPYGICLYSLLRNHRFRDGRRARRPGEFDYYFWTDQSIKEYIEQKSAGTGSEFQNFKSSREVVETADMVRYAFLYEFGGIYLDLDMEPVQSFLPFLERGYPCVVSEENPIQVSSVWRGTFGVTNSIMMCRPGHPFLKLLLQSLPEFKNNYHVVLRTGPRFVTAILERYLAADKKRAEACGSDPTSRDDCVYIAPATHFETLHNIHSHRYRDDCISKLKAAGDAAIAKDALLSRCREYLQAIEERGTFVELANNAGRLAVHHYLHMGYHTNNDRNCAANTFELRNLIRGFWKFQKGIGMNYIPSFA